MARPTKELANQFDGDAASLSAAAKAHADLQAGARGDESPAETAARMATKKAQEEADAEFAAKLEKLGALSDLLEPQHEESETDMTAADIEQYYAKLAQELQDEELASSLADRDFRAAKTSGAVGSAASFKFAPDRGAGRGGETDA